MTLKQHAGCIENTDTNREINIRKNVEEGKVIYSTRPYKIAFDNMLVLFNLIDVIPKDRLFFLGQNLFLYDFEELISDEKDGQISDGKDDTIIPKKGINSENGTTLDSQSKSIFRLYNRILPNNELRQRAYDVFCLKSGFTSFDEFLDAFIEFKRFLSHFFYYDEIEEILRKERNFDFLLDFLRKRHIVLTENQMKIFDFLFLLSERQKEFYRLVHDFMKRNMNVRNHLVYSFKYINPSMHIDDLMQIGAIGMQRAVENFNPNKGSVFYNYALAWIKREISNNHVNPFSISFNSRLVGYISRLNLAINDLKKEYKGHELDLNDPDIRKRLMAATEIHPLTFDALVFLHSSHKVDIEPSSKSTDVQERYVQLVGNIEGAENVLIKKISREILLKVLETLSERDKDIISLYFGIGASEEMTLAEVGEIKGLTRERIRQIRNKILQRLRRKLIERF